MKRQIPFGVSNQFHGASQVRSVLRASVSAHSGWGLFGYSLVLLFLVLAFPGSVLGGPLLERFFPLCNGDSKTFSSTAGDVAITVASTRYRGQAAFELRIRAGGGSTATDQRRYFSIAGDALQYLGMVFSGGGQSVEATFNPPIVMLTEAVLSSGGAQSGKTSAVLRGGGVPGGGYAVNVDYTYSIRSSGPLSVPACSYHDSRSIEGSFTLLDPADPEDPEIEEFPEFLYLAPHVGIAKIQIYAINQFGILIPYGFASLVRGEVRGGPLCLGALQTVIEPAEVNSAGAQWRRTETAVWWKSGVIETGLAAGLYSIEFGAVPGWSVPLPQTVSVGADQTAVVTARYTRVNLTLRGTIREGHSGGSPVPAVAVTLRRGRSTQRTVTDHLGEYVFSGLSAGAYSVAPSHPDLVFVPESLAGDLSGDKVLPVFVARRTVAPPPSLNVQISGGSIVISWPVALTGYLLERAGALGSESRWEQVPISQVITAEGAQSVSLPIQSESAFFRLHKP